VILGNFSLRCLTHSYNSCNQLELVEDVVRIRTGDAGNNATKKIRKIALKIIS
jgi:hypothetical protein